MDEEFITHLPTEVENADFRVIADEGGYSKAISRLYRDPYGQFTVHAQRDRMKVLLEVSVVRDEIARDGNLFCFDGFVGEFLTADGAETGSFVTINNLSIDPVLAQTGQTVGVLKMKQIMIPNSPQEDT